MDPSSDMDPATAALIAQLIAEDLGESYDNDSLPIGASYHDYEEPLSSYERQCLDAENDPDGQENEGSGWGPDFSEGLNGANTHNGATSYDDGVVYDESQYLNEPYKGPWNSRFTDDDGEIQEFDETEQKSQVGVTDDDNRSDPRPCSPPMSEGLAGSSTHVDSLPACDAPTNPAGEIRNISTPEARPTQPAPDAWPELTHEPNDHIEPNESSTPLETFTPLHPALSNEPLPAWSGWQVGDEPDDGLDYSSYKGKGKAVRAYDEFKLGLRDSERRWLKSREQDSDGDSEEDSEEESEIEDESHTFIRIPWPSGEQDELISRREDAEVAEIRVGDDETLESILRDISLRDERRRKGKGVEEHEERGREELPGGDDVGAWW